MIAVDWNEVGAIGQWVGALSTTAAVWVSLSIARKSYVPKVKVDINMMASLQDQMVVEGPFILVQATNTGLIPITLRSSGFEIRSGRKKQPIVPQKAIDVLPVKLEPGASAEYKISPRIFASWLIQYGFSGEVKVRVGWHDTTGRGYESRWKFDIEEWKSIPVMVPSATLCGLTK